METLNKHCGFTLIELTIVMVILGIISTIAYIRWSMPITSLYAQTATFASNLRYAQNLSLSKNERCKLKITTTTPQHSYQILNKNNVPQNMPGVDNTNMVNLEHGIIFDQPTAITDTIIFDGKGVPYTDKTNPESQTTDDITIVLKNTSGQTRTIRIAPKTGKISIDNT